MNRTVFVLFALVVACHTGRDNSKNDNIDAGVDEAAGSSGRLTSPGESEDAALSETCDLESGRYHIIYSRVDGTCAETSFSSIPIDYRYSEIEKWRVEEINYDFATTTEISYQGCKLMISYQVRRNNDLIFHLQGLLEIENNTRLTG